MKLLQLDTYKKKKQTSIPTLTQHSKIYVRYIINLVQTDFKEKYRISSQSEGRQTCLRTQKKQ